MNRATWIDALQSRAVVFAASLAVCLLFLVIRTPFSFLEPDFVAEDGTNYFSSIANDGLLASLGQTHNGYFVVGNILLSEMAIAVDRFFLRGDVRQVPLAIALVSGCYFALLATLPILLLRRRLPLAWLLCLAAIVVGTPLSGFDSGIVGKISNAGYSFVYLAIIVLTYRVCEKPSGAQAAMCDLVLFVCANTNPTVFPLLALAVLPYAACISRGPRAWPQLLKDRSFLSLLLLYSALAATAIHLYALKAYAPTNYLGGPFLWKSAVEMILARELLYPLVASFYRHLTDRSVVCLAAVILAAMVWVLRGQSWRENRVYAIAIAGFSVFAASSAIFRPGLSATMNSYRVEYLPQYFYGMNMISGLLIVLLCHDLTRKLPAYIQRGALVLLLACYVPGILVGGGYGKPDEMTTGPAPFAQDIACAVATRRYANLDGKSSADGKVVISRSRPYINGWCRVFVPKAWAVSSVKRDRELEFAKFANIPIMALRASHGLATPANFHVKGVAQLGYIRPGCTWVHEDSIQLDPWRQAQGQFSEMHFNCRPGDVVFVGDWTGSGKDTVGIFRKGLWLLGIEGTAGTPARTFMFGERPGDIPVAGDWNGDGRTKAGIYRNGAWLLDFDGDGKNENGDPNRGDRTYWFGTGTGDVPVVGDWNGSGRDKIGVFSSGHFWLLDYNGNGTFDEFGVGGDTSFTLTPGRPGDIPVTGDWSGDGRTKTGVFRKGEWLLDVDGNNRLEVGAEKDTIVSWKADSGDLPVVSAHH